MSSIQKLFSEFVVQPYRKLPVGVVSFGKKALLLLVAWTVLYQCLLKPLNQPDKWLTGITTNVTVYVLNVLYHPGFVASAAWHAVEGEPAKEVGAILWQNKQCLLITNGCNAFDLVVLYIGFLFCFRTSIKRLTLFILAGSAGMFILNIARLYCLTIMSIKSFSGLDFAHHYVFTTIVYVCIFATWVLYTNKYGLEKTA